VPEVSVIIPVYNTELFLEDCLNSVLAQTFSDFEIIAVDDGSTDNSAAIVEQFAAKDNRIVIIHQENKGLSEARNTGIKAACGNWITFVDSDDMLAPRFLQKLLDAAKQNNASIACSDKQLFWKDSEIANGETATTQAIALSPEKALERALYQKEGPDYSAWSKLYDAQIWQSRRFTPGIYFEDMDCIPQVLLEAKKVAFVPEPLYLNRRHNTSILATAYNYKKAELLDIAEKICTLVEGKSPELQRAAHSNLFSASCSILMRTPDTDEFKDFRTRAWMHIKEYRQETLFNTSSRTRNKAAALISFGGKAVFEFALRRFG
jgi:glycosyltransferase involved in cell wall biosynthesis